MSAIHLEARRMRVRSIQRVASKSSSVSILKVVSRVIATAAASWSNPQISCCESSPVVHLHGSGKHVWMILTSQVSHDTNLLHAWLHTHQLHPSETP